MILYNDKIGWMRVEKELSVIYYAGLRGMRLCGVGSTWK